MQVSEFNFGNNKKAYNNADHREKLRQVKMFKMALENSGNFFSKYIFSTKLFRVYEIGIFDF